MIDSTTIVITGAGSGIGKAWAEGFLADGARVVAADIDAASLDPLRAQGAITAVTNVAKAGQVKDMINLALDATGRVDVLFNNAGVGFRTRIEDLQDDEFEQHVAIHLFGAVAGMRHAIPAMRKQRFGRIINTISRAAEFASEGASAYAAAKAAIWAATRCAARETEDTDILINMLIPGPTRTGIWGRDMPNLQSPEATFPTARMLACLPPGGPSGRVFWNEQEYRLFSPDNLREGR